MNRPVRYEVIDEHKEQVTASVKPLEPNPVLESAADLRTARSNRAAALAVADWAWRHHEDFGAVTELLDVLGVRMSDLRARPDVIVLP
jgi:hypothetical protein